MENIKIIDVRASIFKNATQQRHRRNKRYVIGIAYNVAISDEKASRVISVQAEADAVSGNKRFYRHNAVRLTKSQLRKVNLIGLPMCLEHTKNAKVGRVLANWVDDKGNMMIAGEIDGNTEAGKRVVELVDSGQLGSFSVQYDVKYDARSGQVKEKSFGEISLCHKPYFEGCDVLTVCANAEKKNDLSITNNQNSIQKHNEQNLTKPLLSSSGNNNNLVEQLDNLVTANFHLNSIYDTPEQLCKSRIIANYIDSVMMADSTTTTNMDASQETTDSPQITTKRTADDMLETQDKIANSVVDNDDEESLLKEDPQEIAKNALKTNDPDALNKALAQMTRRCNALKGVATRKTNEAKRYRQTLDAFEARGEEAKKNYEEKAFKEFTTKMRPKFEKYQSGKMDQEDLNNHLDQLSDFVKDPENIPALRAATVAANAIEDLEAKNAEIEQLKKQLAFNDEMTKTTTTPYASTTTTTTRRTVEGSYVPTNTTANLNVSAADTTQKTSTIPPGPLGVDTKLWSDLWKTGNNNLELTASMINTYNRKPQTF